MLNIALFGPPGAGKGTQSEFLIKKFNLFFRITKKQTLMNIEELINACEIFKKNKTGALFVIERSNSLDFVRNTGDQLNLEISTPIIESIFFKNSPLHDGAVIIEGNFITGARVILPMSEKENIDSRLGLRHRAAFGITEKTDAIAIVVSEEKGEITFIKNGEIHPYQDIENLKTMIEVEMT